MYLETECVTPPMSGVTTHPLRLRLRAPAPPVGDPDRLKLTISRVSSRVLDQLGTFGLALNGYNIKPCCL